MLALTVQAEELLCMTESIHGERTVSEPQDRVTETHRATDGHVGSAARHCELAARLAAHLRRHPRQRIAPVDGEVRLLRVTERSDQPAWPIPKYFNPW